MTKTLLCLHGWGGSSESFTELRAALSGSDVTVHAPNLPGFGNEPDPAQAMTIGDYADWVEAYITKNITGDYELLGHSHGGRTAIKMVSRGMSHPPTHLYLCAAAGIKHPRHVKRVFGLLLAKGGKVLLSVPGLKQLQPLAKKLLYKLVRVHDYEKASAVMQQTLILVSREDLRSCLKNIAIPTDIFWGTDDGMTPISDAYVMHKNIPHSQLHIFQGVRHRIHRDKAAEIALQITKTPAP